MPFGFSSSVKAIRNAFNNTKAKIVNSYNTLLNKAIPGRGAPPAAVQSGPGAPFTVQYVNLANALGSTDAVLTFFVEGLDESMLPAIRDSALQRIKEAVQPISRTDNTESLQNSFTGVIENGEVNIYSSQTKAYVVLTGEGWERLPLKKTLEWMDTKPEFASQDDKERARSAFLIRRSLREGRRPGPKSTLRKLSPVGERKYDYVSEALSNVEKDLAQFNIVFEQAVT